MYSPYQRANTLFFLTKIISQIKSVDETSSLFALEEVISIFIGVYLHAYDDGTDRVFQNVGMQNSDAGELPRRKHTTFRTRRKFEIKKYPQLTPQNLELNFVTA